MSTADERAIWKALAEGATGGPWEAAQGASGGWWVEQPNTATICDVDCDYSGHPGADAEFIAAARTAVPALLADVERLERELAKERARHELHGLLAEEREADL